MRLVCPRYRGNKQPPVFEINFRRNGRYNYIILPCHRCPAVDCIYKGSGKKMKVKLFGPSGVLFPQRC